MEPTTILRDEHRTMVIVLDYLDRAVSAAERGTPVPKNIFSDIAEFFSVFVGQCHYGKEKAAIVDQFAGVDAQQVARSLTEDRERRLDAFATYARMVDAYVPGDVVSAQRLARAAREYGVTLRRHIVENDRTLFPMIEQSFGAVNRRLASEFERIERDEVGNATHERLSRMIDALPERVVPWILASA